MLPSCGHVCRVRGNRNGAGLRKRAASTRKARARMLLSSQCFWTSFKCVCEILSVFGVPLHSACGLRPLRSCTLLLRYYLVTVLLFLEFYWSFESTVARSSSARPGCCFPLNSTDLSRLLPGLRRISERERESVVS